MAILTSAQFRALLDWWMVSDPWPLEEWQHEELRTLIETESDARGWPDWVEAYHRHTKEHA